MGRRNNYNLVRSIICKGLRYLVFFKLSLLFIMISRRNTEKNPSVAIERSWISTWSNKNYLVTKVVWLKHLLMQLFNCASVYSVYSLRLQTLRQSCTLCWLGFIYWFHVSNIIKISTSWVRKASHQQPCHTNSIPTILIK